VLTLSRLIAAALRSGTPIETFLIALRTIRYYAALGDLNGAGSYLLLALFIAIAFAIWAIRDRAFLSTAFSTLIAALLALGLWFTGSRTALATAFVVSAAWCVAATWPRVPRRARGAILAAAAGIVIVAVVAVTRFSQNQIGVSGVLFMRYEMVRVSLSMLQTAPVFGVGIGTFYERSAEFIRAPEVLLYYSRENAHNNFLQVLSETGVVGAVAFLWVLVEAALRLVRGLRTDPSDMVQRGIVAGIAAFLLTTLTGHPLLVPELAYPFWIALGLGCAVTGPAHASTGALSRSAWFIAIALLVAAIPVRLANEAADANLEHVSYGTTGWRMSPEGVRYKEFRGRGVFFIPTGASVVSMVVRSPEGDVRVQVAWNGRPADVLPITGTDWRELRLRVPPSDHQRRYEPMELQIVEPTERRDALVQAGRIVVRALRAQ
jgi:O-Antigen ligase